MLSDKPEIVSVQLKAQPTLALPQAPVVCRLVVGSVKLAFYNGCEDSLLRTVIEEVLTSHV